MESDISILTQDAIQRLQTDTSRNHLAILGEIQTASDQMTKSVDSELKQTLPLLEGRLLQKINDSKTSVETAVSQSQVVVAQSIVAEIDRRLPLLGDSVTSSLAQQIDDCRSSIEARLAGLSVEIQQALKAGTREQIMTTVSILSEDEQEQEQSYGRTDSLESPIISHSLARLKKKRKLYRGIAVKQTFTCNCCPSIGRRCLHPFVRWSFGEKYEEFLIHKRSCPLWYQSQINTKYGVDILLFRRLWISGSINIRSSPYASIFGWTISQNLTCRAVVPAHAPAFKILDKHLRMWKLQDCEPSITECLTDLRTIFQSGQGSPYDTLSGGTTLIEVS
jgi:hypothetical protein